MTMTSETIRLFLRDSERYLHATEETSAIAEKMNGIEINERKADSEPGLWQANNSKPCIPADTR